MGIIGAHMLLYSPEADALRATLRDVFGFEHVDAGDGWLVFALPPSELGVHPAEGSTNDSDVHPSSVADVRRHSDYRGRPAGEGDPDRR